MKEIVTMRRPSMSSFNHDPRRLTSETAKLASALLALRRCSLSSADASITARSVEEQEVEIKSNP